MLSATQIKFVKSLHQKKFRDLNNLFLVEGEKMVSELPKSLLVVEAIFATIGWMEANPGLFPGKAPIHIATKRDLERITTLKTPPAVLAVVKMPIVNYDFGASTGHPTLVLDKIQDPGNLGTIIRTADWFGIKEVVCSKETADLYNPKAIQATMGSFARMNVQYRNLPEFLRGVEGQKSIFGATLKGDPIGHIKPASGSILVIGNESKGISEEVMNFLTNEVTIPGGGMKSAESLNAAVAAGILMAWLTANP